MLHISLAGERLFYFAGVPVTSTLLTTWIVMAILTVLSLTIYARISTIPSRFQAGAELVVGGLYNMFSGILGERTRTYFAVLMTFFIFIIFSNWIGLIPGVGSIGISHEEAVTAEHDAADEQKIPLTPLFRAPTADLNTTFALAIISFGLLQYAGISALGGLGYLKKFINFSNPIYFFVGILEIISELGKIISFAFRLFGNIFAGEVLLVVTAFLIPLFAPIPFLGLEIFVGFIQALVFSMLTAVFLAAATSHAH
ncbi:MAG TPA: F0F1 ATP synthase subunit A [Patescibacteria group bacterium]|nr:F0F1 ATP synthase subunit A [Patescibacteria group bacterium]